MYIYISIYFFSISRICARIAGDIL